MCAAVCAVQMGYIFSKAAFRGPAQPQPPASSEAENAHWEQDRAEIFLPAWLPGILGRQQPLPDVSLGEYSPFPLSLSQKKKSSSVTRNKGRSVCCAVHQSCCLLNPMEATCRTHSMFGPSAEPSPAQGCCWLKVALLLELWILHGCRQCSWRICLVKISSQFDLIYVMYPAVFLKIIK